MGNRRSVLLAFLMGQILSGMACADMMPVTRSGVGPARVRHESTSAGFDQADTLNLVSNVSGIINLDLAIDESLAGVMSETEQSTESQGIQCAEDGVSSFHLCLYGLFSLGLCQCRPIIKSVSLGIIPEWYHDGGPQQIGHSYAFVPGYESCFTTFCFVQPAPNTNYVQSPNYFGTVAALWRTSQFTPAAIAPRGPPCMS